MTSLEDLEKMDITAFFQSKGHAIQAFRREYLETEQELLTISTDIAKREKEYDNLFSELHSLKDQHKISERLLAELKLSKGAVIQAIDQAKAQNNESVNKCASNKEEIEAYRIKYEELKVFLTKGYDWTPAQIDAKNTLEIERDFLESKLDSKDISIKAIRKENETLFEKVQELEQEIIHIDARKADIDKSFIDAHDKAHEENKKREALERKIFMQRDEVKKLDEDINENVKLCKFEENAVHEMDKNLAEIRQRMEDSINEYTNLYHKLEQCSNELEKNVKQVEKLEGEIKERAEYNILKREEIAYYNKEIEKLTVLRKAVNKKCQEADEHKRIAEEKRDTLQNTLTHIHDVEMVNLRKENETYDKQINSLNKQLNILRKKTTSTEKSSYSVNTMIELYKTNIQNLEYDKQQFIENINQQKEKMQQLLLEKENYERIVEDTSKSYYIVLEELKLQEIQSKELQKKINDDTNKLRLVL